MKKGTIKIIGSSSAVKYEIAQLVEEFFVKSNDTEIILSETEDLSTDPTVLHAYLDIAPKKFKENSSNVFHNTREAKDSYIAGAIIISYIRICRAQKIPFDY
jgi:hypothetical protein